MTSLPLSKLIHDLGEARAKAVNAYMIYKDLKEIEDSIRYNLHDELRTIGLQSVKGNEYTASITNKQTVLVTNERLVIDWLNNTPNVESDQYIGLKATEFKSFAQSILKDTGEIIPGTDVQVRESLAIRSNVKKGK